MIIYFIVIIFSILTIFLLTVPIIRLVALLPIFRLISFFPGQAEGYATIPGLFLILLMSTLVVKFLFKKWRYVLTSFSVMTLTLAAMFIVGQYRTNKFFQGLYNETNQAIEKSKQTQIIITNFEETPTLDNSQNLEKISFKFDFISNVVADMNIAPKVRFNGKHVAGNDFLFWYDPTRVKFNGEIKNFDILKSFYSVMANEPQKIEFIFDNLSSGREYMVDLPGHFEAGIIFSIHVSDPLGYGQGNATEINNIVDKSGKSIKEEFVGEVLHFNSKEYLIRK